MFQEQRREIAAVERFGADTGNAGERREGREQVDGAGDLGDRVAGGKFGGPAHPERGAYAALVGGGFAVFHAAVVAERIGAVVGEVDDDGIFGDAEFFEEAENAADVGVLVFHHGEGAAGLVEFFAGGVGGGLRDGFILEARPVGGGRGPRRVGRGEGHVAEKRFRVMALDKVEGAVGADIDDVAGGADHTAVFLEGRVEVFAPMAGGVTEIFVEATGFGVVGPLAAVVPFAESAGGIAGGSEGVGEGFFVEVEALEAGGDAAHAGAGVVAAGEEFGAGGSADGLDKKAVEAHAAGGDGVDVRRADGSVAVETVVAPASVVGEEDDDVGRAGRARGGEERGRKKEGERKGEKESGGERKEAHRGWAVREGMAEGPG